MQNETQNQDTQAAPQQPVVEEAQAAPEQAMDDTQAATSEVHDDPGVPQQEEQQQGITVGEPDPSSPGGDPVSEDVLERAAVMPDGWDDPSSPDYHSELLDGEDPSSLGGDPSWEIGSDEWVEALGLDADPMSHEEAQRIVKSEIADGVGVPYSDGSLWDSFSPDIPEDDGNGVSESTPPEAVSMPHDKIVDPVPADQGEGLPSNSGEEDGDSTPGGYDGSGIAGGLDLDQDGMPENTGINPHVQPDFPGNDPVSQHEGNIMPDEMGTNPDTSEGEGYAYDEGAYEDAEDAFEDLQDALQDGDEEDLAEALEELQGYLGGFDKGAAEEEDPTGDDPAAAGANAQEDPEDPSEGVIEDDGEGGIDPADVDYQEVLDDLDSGNLDDVREFLEDLAGGGDKEAQDAPGGGHEHGHFANEGISLGDIVGEKDEYAYDEGAYEDAEDAFEDLQDALQDGDEEDLAEALEELQGYLGGFDKGAAEEEDQDGTETQVDQIPSDSEENSDGNFLDFDNNGVDDTKQDSDGDGLYDLEESDRDGDGIDDLQDWDRNNDGVLDLSSFHDEADSILDAVEPVDTPDASGAAVSGAAVGAAGAAAGAGAVDQAIDAGTQWAGGAIDEALGIEGSGKVLENVANGNFEEALGTVAEEAGGAIDEALGIEGSGEILENVLDGDFDEALEGIGEKVGDFFEDIDNPFW